MNPSSTERATAADEEAAIQAPEARGQAAIIAARAQTRWSRVMKTTSRLWRR